MNQHANQSAVIAPSATIGILGSGQLGRVMAIAAKHMGYRVHVLSPSHDSPAGQVADLEVQASFEDLTVVEAFAKQVDVVTIESENIPLETLEAAAEFAPTFPGREALAICQNRGKEKQFLAEHGIPTCRFHIVQSLDELREACGVTMPGVLKTTTGGYDGKGQIVIQSEADFDDAWTQLNCQEAILEEWVDYEFEFSTLVYGIPLD